MKDEINQEILESYKEYLSKYCYAVADVPIRKDEDGEWYIDGDLEKFISIMGGHFTDDYVAREIKLGDFPFKGVDREGWWNIDILLKHHKGDYDEPDELEILLTEASFVISFEEQKEIDEMVENNPFPFI